MNTINRPLAGKGPKEVQTVFFYRGPDRESVMLNYVACGTDQETHLGLTRELIHIYLNDAQLVPRSSYRKVIGEGVRAIAYGAHTSLAAHRKKSHKFVTSTTTADMHEQTLFVMS